VKTLSPWEFTMRLTTAAAFAGIPFARAHSSLDHPPRRRASIELLNKKEPRRGSDQALSGRRRAAYCTRNVDPKALPQASSAFRSVVCENIPNIAPHIAANIRMGMVCLRLHSEHQLARGLRRSIQNRSSTNISLYKIAHCNLLRSELCLPYSIRRRGAPLSNPLIGSPSPRNVPAG
jgi:hypothetical protein